MQCSPKHGASINSSIVGSMKNFIEPSAGGGGYDGEQKLTFQLMPEPARAPEPLAIVGYSFRFPQDATFTDAFWDMLCKKICTMSEWPKDRLSIDSFYHPDNSRVDCVSIPHVSLLSS